VVPILWSLSVLVTILTWIVGRHRPEHRPIAWLLAYGLASDAVRELIGARVLRPLRAEHGGAPFTGWPRVLCDVDNALFLGWTAGFAALAVWVYSRRRPWGVGLVYVVAVAVLAAGYPTIRGELLGRAYLACHLAALCVSIGCFLPWYAGSEPAKAHHIVTGLIVISELSMLAGPFKFGIFTTWDLARSILVALYITLVPVQGVALWRRT
jgi:hypothetical protein